jgi:methylthioribose-1-phosphate isomerase
MIETIEWKDSAVIMIDQRQLPWKEVYQRCTNSSEVAEAIRTMVIRGAPAIGIAAAMGIALGMKNVKTASLEELDRAFERISGEIAATRPTAVNLFWAVERMEKVYREKRAGGHKSVAQALVAEACAMKSEDIETNKSMGRLGQELIPANARILTHCNAGALATAGYGTALGVMRAAVEAGKKLQVYVDETRPFLQGARLTAWELNKDGIPAIIITDSMAGHFIHRGRIDCIIVGADRIAANGDVANKIGTYSIAVIAKENGVPFYVAAPISTLDLSIPDGSHIPIEERHEDEVKMIQGVPITPEGVPVANPAFDVTPHRYISAIITERAVVRPPFSDNLRLLR